MEDLCANIKVGDRCDVEPGEKRGALKFVGRAENLALDYWVGVQYDELLGKHDGMLVATLKEIPLKWMIYKQAMKRQPWCFRFICIEIRKKWNSCLESSSSSLDVFLCRGYTFQGRQKGRGREPNMLQFLTMKNDYSLQSSGFFLSAK